MDQVEAESEDVGLWYRRGNINKKDNCRLLFGVEMKLIILDTFLGIRSKRSRAFGEHSF